jgi:hypothetical protein
MPSRIDDVGTQQVKTITNRMALRRPGIGRLSMAGPEDRTDLIARNYLHPLPRHGLARDRSGAAPTRRACGGTTAVFLQPAGARSSSAKTARPRAGTGPTMATCMARAPKGGPKNPVRRVPPERVALLNFPRFPEAPSRERKMKSWDVEEAITRRSCGSGRCGWSPRWGRSIRRTGRGSWRSRSSCRRRTGSAGTAPRADYRAG